MVLSICVKLPHFALRELLPLSLMLRPWLLGWEWGLGTDAWGPSLVLLELWEPGGCSQAVSSAHPVSACSWDHRSTCVGIQWGWISKDERTTQGHRGGP